MLTVMKTMLRNLSSLQTTLPPRDIDSDETFVEQLLQNSHQEMLTVMTTMLRCRQ